jgi:hypothetical protein
MIFSLVMNLNWINFYMFLIKYMKFIIKNKSNGVEDELRHRGTKK